MKRNRLSNLAVLAGILLLLILSAARLTLYVVDERELAVVLRFGNPVRTSITPGIRWKLPFVENVRRLPRTRQFWGDRPGDVLPDLPTKDDKKIEVVPWAIWRIKDPAVFVQRLRTMDEAEKRVAQFTRGAIRDVITQYDLAELVRSTDRALTTSSTAAEAAAPTTDQQGARRAPPHIRFGREKILSQIKEEARRRLASGADDDSHSTDRGIELIDLGISHIDFVASVRTKTFDRWVAERQAISARNLNEGERRKQEIVNRAGAEVERIQGEGQRQAHEIRGKVDAKIIHDYAAAINKVGDFYTFVRTLEAYESAIDPNTRLILTTDNPFLQLLQQGPSATGTQP